MASISPSNGGHGPSYGIEIDFIAMIASMGILYNNLFLSLGDNEKW
jgi:hypothetical protein